jgi:hypothetical protein
MLSKYHHAVRLGSLLPGPTSAIASLYVAHRVSICRTTADPAAELTAAK